MFNSSQIKFHLLVFPVIALLLLGIILAQNYHLFQYPYQSVIYTYIDAFQEGKIGSGYGSHPIDNEKLPDLEEGDLVLGGWSNCAYGRFSHAGLYIGNSQVLEAYADYGISIHKLDHYLDYSELCFLQVETDTEIKQKAVQYANQFEGKMFYPLAFKKGNRFWNCTKIIWKAYQLQGVDLDEINDLWIAPESFYCSPHVEVLYERGAKT